MDRILKVNYLIDDKSYTRTYLTVMDTLEEAIQEVTTVVNDRIKKFGGELISVVQDV